MDVYGCDKIAWVDIDGESDDDRSQSPEVDQYASTQQQQQPMSVEYKLQPTGEVIPSRERNGRERRPP